ncbi:hypothetical protein FRB93_006825 [Tulasnella sp. JGI-2019a]|nr:hypothetical protein FRB93_006825 [Tulasnella sp. JGI-2019a]
MSTLQRVGSYLVEVLLQNEYTLKDLCHPILLSMPADLASGALNQQIIAYVRWDYPFNQDPALGESTRDWWSNLVHHSGASILALLAIKLFSICSNSMADECTMFVVTRLNTPLRSQQDAQTLVDQIQITTFTQNGPDQPPPAECRPTVKWRDLNIEKVLGVKQAIAAESKAGLELGCDRDDDDDDESEEVNHPATHWLDEESESLIGQERKMLLAGDFVDLSSHKLLDLLASTEVKAPEREVLEAESILPPLLPPPTAFKFAFI